MIPIYQIVCWRCQNVRSKNGKGLRKITSTDYACDDCLAWGSPTEPNVSRKLIYVKQTEKVNKKRAGVQASEAGISEQTT